MIQTAFSNLGAYLQAYWIMDFILPFILVFTIIFAVTAKLPLFKDNKNFRVVIALVLGLMFVVPHITGYYPLGYDPVEVMNASLPSIALVAVAAIMLLILMGLFGTDFSKSFAPVIAIAAIAFVIYIFGAALTIWSGPWDFFYWWTPDVTELIIILLVFGIIVWLITKEKSATPGGEFLSGIGKWFEKK